MTCWARTTDAEPWEEVDLAVGSTSLGIRPRGAPMEKSQWVEFRGIQTIDDLGESGPGRSIELITTQGPNCLLNVPSDVLEELLSAVEDNKVAAQSAPNPPATAGRNVLPMLRIVRVAVFMLLAAASIIVAANEPDADTADIAVARFSADTNEDTATGAPQQQVVNGWEAADLLDVIATRSIDNRVPLLLLIVVFTLCWQFTTASWSGRLAAD
jgi:hypothetical protein